MNAVARLAFLAFLALSGTIVYNALYLQDLRGINVASPATRPPRVPISVEISPPAMNPPQAVASIEVSPPPVSTDLPALEEGKGESLLLVRAIQRELAARGYEVGAMGHLTEKTSTAISTYQRREGLTVTGLATDDLLHHILLGGGVEGGPAGSARAGEDTPAPADENTVKAVQQLLADLGYAPGAIDGAVGSATVKAINAFQRDRKIDETGRITPELLDELKRVTGRDLTKTAAKP